VSKVYLRRFIFDELLGKVSIKADCGLYFRFCVLVRAKLEIKVPLLDTYSCLLSWVIDGCCWSLRESYLVKLRDAPMSVGSAKVHRLRLFTESLRELNF